MNRLSDITISTAENEKYFLSEKVTSTGGNKNIQKLIKLNNLSATSYYRDISSQKISKVSHDNELNPTVRKKLLDCMKVKSSGIEICYPSNTGF